MTLTNIRKCLSICCFCILLTPMVCPAAPPLTDDEVNTLIMDCKADYLKELAARGEITLDRKLDDGLTLLHLAAYHDNLEVAEFLIQQGADINTMTGSGFSPLGLAISESNREMAKLLLKHGAQTDIADEDGLTLVDWVEGEDEYLYLLMTRKDQTDLVDAFFELVNFTDDETFAQTSDTLLGKFPSLLTYSDSEQQTLLHFFAANGETVKMGHWLKSGAPINARTKDGLTPLMLAALYAGTDTVNLLLQNNPDLMAVDSDGETALEKAAENWSEAVYEIIQAKVLDSVPDYAKLLDAIKQSDEQTAIEIVQKERVLLVLKDENGWLPIHHAARGGMASLAKALIEAGSSLSATVYSEDEDEDFTVLNLAVKHNHRELIPLFMAIDPQLIYAGYSVLYQAIDINDTALMQQLLDRISSDKDNQDASSFKSDALGYLLSLETPDQEMFALLIQDSDRLNPEDKETDSLLFDLANKKLWGFIDVAIAAGADISWANDSGNTILTHAVYKHSTALVKQLMPYKPSLTIQNEFGDSPLCAAIDLQFDDIIALFLGAYKDFEQPAGDGDTGLHKLVQKHQFELLKPLIQSGADINIKNSKHLTPLMESVLKNDTAAIAWLLENGANPDDADGDSTPAIVYAVRRNNHELVNLFMEKGANIHCVTRDKQNLLHLAAFYGDPKMVDLFIGANVDADMEDIHYLKPWHYALATGKSAVVKRLVGLLKKPEPAIPANHKNLFDDPVIQYINALYLGGYYDQAIKEIEAGLARENCNPLLVMMWVNFYDAAELLDQALADAPDAIKEKVALSADVQLIKNADHESQLLAKYPNEFAFEPRDFSAVIQLNFEAEKYGTPKQQFGYLLTALKMFPEVYQTIWSMTDTSLLRSDVRQMVSLCLETDAVFEHTRSKDVLLDYMNHQGEQRIKSIQILKAWLAEYPYDARAAAALSYDFENNHYYLDGFYAILRGVVFSPFYSNSPQLAKILIKLEKHGEAEGFLRHFENVRQQMDPEADGPTGDKSIKVWQNAGYRLAQAYSDSGDESRARELLKENMAQWPGFEKNYRLLGKIESSAGRHDQALKYYKKYNELKSDQDSLELLIGQYEKMGINEEALSLIQTHFNNETMPVSVYNTLLSVYRAQKDTRKSQELIEYFLAKTDQTSVLLDYLDLLAQKEQYDKIIKYLTPCIDKYYFNEDQTEQLARYFKDNPFIDGPGVWLETIPKLRNMKAGHLAHAAVNLPGSKAQIEYYENLRQQHKDAFWIVKPLVDLYEADNQWENLFALFDDYLAAVPYETISANDVDGFVVFYAWSVHRKSTQEKIRNKALISRGFDYLEDYHRKYGNQSQYHRYRESLYEADQQKNLAAKEQLAFSKFKKDDAGLFHDMVAKYEAENRNEGFKYGYRMLQRSPFNTNKIENFLHKHAYWSGSPIAVLKEIARIKAEAIDGVPYEDYEKQALGLLGDSLTEFSAYSKGGKYVGSSERYVNWFDLARKGALSNDSKTIRYNFNSDVNEVKIIDKEGFVTVRRDHPVFGRLTLAQKGPSWVKTEYTDKGKLARLSTSNGRAVALKYNEQGKIETMTDTDGTALSFCYNEAGRPIKIIMDGTGFIHVSYSQDGEIEKVFSPEGHTMALKVTQAFQNLLSLNKLPETFLREGRMPEIASEDDRITLLKNACEAGENGAYEKYVAFLVDNVEAGKNYFETAQGLLEEKLRRVYDQFQAGFTGQEITPADLDTALFNADKWQQLMRKMKPEGLPIADFSFWQKIMNMVLNLAFETQSQELKAFWETQGRQPLQLLANSNWLYHSNFINQGYWYRYPSNLMQFSGRKLKHRVMAVRNNKDVVLGTDKGLLVNRFGYWQHYVFNGTQQQFVSADGVSSCSNQSDVLSMLEDGDSLWVGTADSLLKMGLDYNEAPVVFNPDNSGLQSARIQALASTGNGIFIGTPKGLCVLKADSPDDSGGTAKITPLIDHVDVTGIFAHSESRDRILVSTSDAVYLVDKDLQYSRLSDQPAKSILFISQDRVWLLNQSNQIHEYSLREDRMVKTKLVLSADDLTLSQQVYAMALFPWEDESLVPVILTDMGLNLYKDHHLLFMELPYKRERNGLTTGAETALVSDQQDLWLMADDGVYAFLPSKVNHVKGKVRAMARDENLKATYVATDSGVYLYPDNEPLNSDELCQRFSSIRTNTLYVDSKGNLYANDHFDILRFAPGSTDPENLFNARPNVPEEIADWWTGKVRQIMVSSSGEVWVVAGSSVWRWRENGEAQEFNYAVDPEKFPSKSQMIFNIYEDITKKIKVVCSNEGHLQYQGVHLSGGELIWSGDQFIRPEEAESGWFVNGFTRIDDTTAILGTNGSFYREKNGSRSSCYWTGSYKHMDQTIPMLFLGGTGSRFSSRSNTWLFPCAGGLVVYHNGQWFYPDRLNQLLPEDSKFGQYGGRTVHAVAITDSGRILAGTDLGVMIYDADSVESFLISQNQGNSVFLDRDADHFELMRKVFLEEIDTHGQKGHLVHKYREIEKQIDALRQLVDSPENEPGQGQDKSAQNETADDDSQADKMADLKKRLKQRELAREKLLAKIETEHYGWFQMLKLDPREARQMGKKLSDGQVLVQYLPTPDKLYINVVTNKESWIREVTVKCKAVEDLVTLVNQWMRQAAARKRGIGVKPVLPLVDQKEFMKSLSDLYQILICPVEQYLKTAEHVFISPCGKLSYLPFSALIAKIKNGQPEYAVERYNFAVIPSLYHLDLVLNRDKSYSTMALLAADPDESLPGARREVTGISKFLDDTTTLMGDQFTMQNLESHILDARIVHLATHGVLNEQSPASSYILLANKKRLDMPAISTMKFSDTDLVVLSACQTGIGVSGMEMATLARAFALSNVPTIVASYWKVNDAATERLMIYFYQQYQKNDDIVLAFCQAQRKMISNEEEYADPSCWSAFSVIGRP